MKSINNLTHPLIICLLLLSTASHAQVQTSSGLKLVASGPVKLVFQDAGLINHGEFLPGNSTILFKGNHSSSHISGSRPVSFHDLVIDKEGQELILNNNLHITGTLAMDNGNLELNGYELNLGNTGCISGERNVSRITGSHGGTIRAVALLNAPRAVNPGNIGVEITSAASLGETVIIRGHSSGFTTDGRPVVYRYYDISPQHNFNLQASLKFHYLDAELNSLEGALAVYSSKTERGSWMESGKDGFDVSTNWILKNELDQLHRFTLAATTNKALIQQPGKTTLQLFPNPTPDQFTVVLNSAEEKEAAVNLYDQLGRLLESKRIKCRAGTNTILWSIGRYAAGTYYLSFENLDLKMVKVIKQ